MGQYQAKVSWARDGASFLDSRYSRAHEWSFDGGLTVPASASPAHVPPAFANAAAVDPEEALVASVSSCHMLWFLFLAAKAKYCVDRYVDDAVGVMGKNPEGRLAITRITLRPAIQFSDDRMPTPDELDRLHHAAHAECYIANSLKTEIVVEPTWSSPADVTLREVHMDDLAVFYEDQRDAEAARMADFPSRDHDAFYSHWAKVLGDNANMVRTIVVGDEVAGNVCSWGPPEERLVGYWIGKRYWGRGVATRALAAFLDVERTRPLYAHVAVHNAGSIRVLEKCGFAAANLAVSPVHPDDAEGERILVLHS